LIQPGARLPAASSPRGSDAMDDSIDIPETEVIGPDKPSRRPPARKAFGQIVIVVATALSLGGALKQRAMIGANDISRWCTVWALLERGTYAIDECPWQLRTQDKVKLPEPFPPEGEEPVERFYSSKPPLLPTLIAGALWPVRQLTGVPLDAKVTQERSLRTEVQSLEDEPPEDPDRILAVYEDKGYRVVDITSDEPVEWPAHALYFSAVVVLLNVVPLTIGLILYSRLLDRFARDDWAWLLSLAAAALGTNLLIFTTTLNNHTVAAWSGFFALYALFRVWEGARHWGYYATAGFFGACCACNELPAAAFGGLLFLLMLAQSPSKTLKAGVHGVPGGDEYHAVGKRIRSRRPICRPRVRTHRRPRSPRIEPPLRGHGQRLVLTMYYPRRQLRAR